MATWGSPLWGTTTFGAASGGSGGSYAALVFSTQLLSTVPPIALVTPQSTIDIAFDFSPWLATGETISGDVTWSASKSTVTVTSTDHVDSIAYCRFMNTMADGDSCLATCAFQTSLGRVARFSATLLSNEQ